MRGRSKIQLGKPYGSYFWDDVMKIDISGSNSESVRVSREDLQKRSLLASNLSESNRDEPKGTTKDGLDPGFLVYACFFQSTKTVKRITSAIFDIVVLAILALYRQRLIINYNSYTVMYFFQD